MSLRSFEEDLFAGRRDANLRFSLMRTYLARLGFHERVNGSHHIYTRPGTPGVLNLQPQGSRCKTYQVNQVRKFLARNELRL